MIVSKTPPPSKYWSADQKTWYDICLKDKNCTLAYYMTTKDGLPLHSPNKRGWKAQSGIVQKVEPSSRFNKIIPCSRYALHATLDVEPWVLLNCKIWVVAMIGKIVETDNKICALKRRIIGSYKPKDLSDELNLIVFPNIANRKYKSFKNVAVKANIQKSVIHQNISNVDFTKCKFTNCVFENIIFTNCNFENAFFNSCKFLYCTFENCRFDMAYMKEGCQLSNLTIIGKINNFGWNAPYIPDGCKIKDGFLVKLNKGK